MLDKLVDLEKTNKNTLLTINKHLQDSGIQLSSDEVDSLPELLFDLLKIIYALGERIYTSDEGRSQKEIINILNNQIMDTVNNPEKLFN